MVSFAPSSRPSDRTILIPPRSSPFLSVNRWCMRLLLVFILSVDLGIAVEGGNEMVDTAYATEPLMRVRVRVVRAGAHSDAIL